MRVEKAAVNDLIDVDLASRAATGQGVGGLGDERVSFAHGGGDRGDFAVKQYREKGRLAQATYNTTVFLRGASLEEGNATVAGAVPRARDPAFDDKARLAATIRDEWRRQLRLHHDGRADPASSSRVSAPNYKT